MLYVSGLGQHEVRLNGQKVGQAVIEPSWSNYRKTCYYRTCDVTALLRPGENAIGVMLGNGMYNVVGGRYIKFKGSFGPPKLICQLEVEHADGSRTVVASDGSWKWSDGPIRFSCTFGGEDYDAREEQSGWDAAGFDDAAWSAVSVTDGPGGQLRSEIVQPIQPMIEYKPVKVTQLEPGVWVYDLGQNFSGWPQHPGPRAGGRAGQAHAGRIAGRSRPGEPAEFRRPDVVQLHAQGRRRSRRGIRASPTTASATCRSKARPRRMPRTCPPTRRGSSNWPASSWSPPPTRADGSSAPTNWSTASTG